MVTRAQVVNEARSWIGVPFRHLGRDRHGVDCIGLPLVVARQLGLRMPDYPGGNYTRRGAGFDLVKHCIAHADMVPLAQARDGDVIVFNEGAIPCHVGILANRGGARYVVQAIGRVAYNRVAETPWAGEWEKKARYAFKFRELED